MRKVRTHSTKGQLKFVWNAVLAIVVIGTFLGMMAVANYASRAALHVPANCILLDNGSEICS